jgi:hypothetical protein
VAGLGGLGHRGQGTAANCLSQFGDQTRGLFFIAYSYEYEAQKGEGDFQA